MVTVDELKSNTVDAFDIYYSCEYTLMACEAVVILFAHDTKAGFNLKITLTCL